MPGRNGAADNMNPWCDGGREGQAFACRIGYLHKSQIASQGRSKAPLPLPCAGAASIPMGVRVARGPALEAQSRDDSWLQKAPFVAARENRDMRRFFEARSGAKASLNRLTDAARRACVRRKKHVARIKLRW